MDRRDRVLIAAFNALRALDEPVSVRSLGAMARRIGEKGVHLEYVRSWLKNSGCDTPMIHWSDTEFVLKTAKIDTVAIQKRYALDTAAATLFPVETIGTPARKTRAAVPPKNDPGSDAAGGHAILSEVFPVVQSAGIAFSAATWFARNKSAARDLHRAGRSPRECARMMALAIERGGDFYGGIRMLIKLQEHWGSIAKLAAVRGAAEDPNRVQRVDLS